MALLIIKKTLEAHHFNAKLLESFGVNACKQYKCTKAEAALNAVSKDDTECRICGKKSFSTMHTLRSHIQSIHIKVTKNQCDLQQPSDSPDVPPKDSVMTSGPIDALENGT